MAKTRKYSVTEMRKAIEKHGASTKAVAAALNCSSSTIYSYRRKYPEIAQAWDAAGGSTSQKKQYPREKFEQAIQDSNGILQNVADAVGCARQTVYNAFDEWPELRTMFDDARYGLVDQAESVIVDTLRAEDEKLKFSAAKYVTSTLGKDRGWASRSEVTGADGAALFTDEDRELMVLLGVDESEAVAQFKKMLRLKAAALTKV